MIFNIGGRPNPATMLPEFTFSGRYDLINDGVTNGVQNWRIRLYESGALTFTRTAQDAEVFLVGGGGGGAAAGGGGAGGYTQTGSITLVQNETYPITIGDGGMGSLRGTGDGGTAGGMTSAFGLIALGGNGGKYQGGITGTYGGDGGSGGGGFGGGHGGADGSSGGQGISSAYPGGAGQGTSTREFGEPFGQLYAGGGGGGTYSNWGGVGGIGGAGGGGDGHQSDSPNGRPGQPNTGGGGGGGWRQSDGGDGGNGGSGIVVIRNRRY